MKYVIFLISVFVCFTSCLPSFIEANVIRGRLLQNCDGLPVSNGVIILKGLTFMGGTTICDSSMIAEDGSFIFHFNGPANFIEFEGRDLLSFSLGGSIPEGDVGNLIVENRGTLRITLKVFDPKTTADTLEIHMRNHALKIAGPFTDGDTHLIEDIDLYEGGVDGFSGCASVDSTCTFCSLFSVVSGIKQVKDVSMWNESFVGLCGCGITNELEVRIE